MKAFTSILALIALAGAAPIAEIDGAPVAVDAFVDISKRQTSEDEFTQNGCRPILFFFARGSTEPGNLGSTVGPGVSQGLKGNFGETRVSTEGVEYPALLSTNFLPEGADPVGIRDMTNLFNQGVQRCPNSVIVAGGYSQGAAVTHAAIKNLSTAVKNKIVGVVTFGDTRNQQDGGQIPGYPRDRTLIICNPGDLVCSGTLIIAAPHLAYGPRVPEAVTFLTNRIRASGVQ